MLKKRPLVIFLTFALCLFLQMPTPAHAESDTAYIVASDETFNSIPGIRGYISDGSIKIVHIGPQELGKLKNVKQFLVFGNPDAKDAVGDFIRKNLSKADLNNARHMGKARLVQTTIEGKEAVVFASSFSLQTLVKSSADSWKEIFETWYGIEIPITQIIGY